MLTDAGEVDFVGTSKGRHVGTLGDKIPRIIASVVLGFHVQRSQKTGRGQPAQKRIAVQVSLLAHPASVH